MRVDHEQGRTSAIWASGRTLKGTAIKTLRSDVFDDASVPQDSGRVALRRYVNYFLAIV
jgi:hypothetical protein